MARWKGEGRPPYGGLDFVGMEAQLLVVMERLRGVVEAVRVLSDQLEEARIADDYGAIVPGLGAKLWNDLSPLLGVSGRLMDVADSLESRLPGARGPGTVDSAYWEARAAVLAD
jgi:hypothetical protein